MSNYKPSADLKNFITYVEDKLFDRDYFFYSMWKEWSYWKNTFN